MTKYISCTDTAKLVRAALKEKFPKQTFSVRSSSYSGGSSIDVTWKDGPTAGRVGEVTKNFAGATFDGMTDSASYHTSDFKGETVSFGANYVFCHRELSYEFLTNIVEDAKRKYGLKDVEVRLTPAYGKIKGKAYFSSNDYQTCFWINKAISETSY